MAAAIAVGASVAAAIAVGASVAAAIAVGASVAAAIAVEAGAFVACAAGAVVGVAAAPPQAARIGASSTTISSVANRLFAVTNMSFSFTIQHNPNITRVINSKMRALTHLLYQGA